MESRHHAPEEFLGKFGSKRDLYQLLTVDLRFYLPSFERTSLDFLRQILAKKKKALRYDQAKCLVVPKFKELSVDKFWPYIKEIDELNAYFPDFKQTEKPERAYMWTIISTLRPDQTKKLVEDVRKHRSQQDIHDENELVEVDPEIFREIKAVLLQKTHTGKTPYLLKKSVKLKRERAQPKVFQANYSLLSQRQLQTPHRGETSRFQSRSIYSTPTIEMKEEDKKESDQ